jgi:urease accessory protein UreF
MQHMEAIRPHLDSARAEAIRWFGDWHPLVRQIAPGEGIANSQSSVFPSDPQATASVSALHSFLDQYRRSVLFPFELPAVGRACELVQRRQTRELLAMDLEFAAAVWLQPYAEDSRGAGRLHLQRLKPLRDERGLRRYIRAVETEEAHGWHFLIAGAALALYSLPLRQGLMDYALHTLWNAVGQAAPRMGLKRSEASELVQTLAADLPAQLQSICPRRTVVAL